ncbi:MAG: hypothetical protein HXP25_00470 [Veillonella sp.]|jgi:hypothetical protein|nr:hypothetical protein [Veillonella sp.]
MDGFSEKALMALGECYVYGLIDPRGGKKEIFYIGKGTGNRVFEHERESTSNPGSEKEKLERIEAIRDAGFEVEKIIINSNLSEEQAFAAEAALINVFRYIGSLTNIVAGHHSAGALTVEEFERVNGAIDLEEGDIRHRILVIKINKLYKELRGDKVWTPKEIDEKDLYDAVRGVWRMSYKRAHTIDYVFGVYNSLIVAVYKPTAWYVYGENKDKLPREGLDIGDEFAKNKDRLFFEDKDFEQALAANQLDQAWDEHEQFYRWKSIAKLKVNQSAQNPITYLNPIGDKQVDE